MPNDDTIIDGPNGIKLIVCPGEPPRIVLETGDSCPFWDVEASLEVSEIRLTTAQQNWIRRLGEQLNDALK